MYTNKKTLAAGFQINSQSPMDDRLVFDTLANLQDLGTGNREAYRYFEGITVFCLEDNKMYAWLESATGLLPTSFTYPADSIGFGIDYSGRSFNFVEVANTAGSITGSGTLDK